ncbi:hypothetical protein ACF08N_23215 [Streptomyces sp. NPDC015127]|uniref:hypothetical protein n=1 Tax=Streptomyces sp. NPDC015127 TaxID=3364939 RepID=UPI003701EA3B
MRKLVAEGGYPLDEVTEPRLVHFDVWPGNRRLHPPTVTAARLLYWSHWRRHHQATARRSHYRRRSADEPAG